MHTYLHTYTEKNRNEFNLRKDDPNPSRYQFALHNRQLRTGCRSGKKLSTHYNFSSTLSFVK